MPRTTIPELTAERLATRIGTLLTRHSSGSVIAGVVLENVIWTIQVIGFDRSVIADLLTDAAKQAELPPEQVLGEMLPAEKSVKRTRNANVSGDA